jgi:Domain of unknown function (DUF4340)
MKNRGTYALLALFFAGLVGLWVADFAQIPTRKQRERMSSRILHELVDTKPDDVQKIEIFGGPEPLVFERRKGNRWQMTAPMDVAADPSKVETLAYNLKELSRKPEAATLEGDPAQYGLAPPERTIRLWGSSTAEPLASLEVGRISLDRRYVRATGTEGVEVVDAKGLDLLRLPSGRWRDQELFRVPSFEVDAVTITRGGQILKLKRGRDAWRIVEPIPSLAVEARVDGLIADLGSLRVLDETRFVAGDVRDAELERYGLRKPVMTIEIEAGRRNGQRSQQILEVGKPVEGKEGLVYAKRAEQDDVVAVDSRLLKDLKPDPLAFRSPKVADIDVARVVRVGVSEGDGSEFEVLRTGNDWTIVRPSPSRGDRQAMQNFLKSLDQLQTSTYLDARAATDTGLDKPSLVLKVWQVRDPREPAATSSADPNGELALTLRIGRRSASTKSIFAQVEGDSTILALPDSAYEFLPRNSLAFRDRQVLGLATDQIQQLSFERPNRPKVKLNAPVLKMGSLTGMNAPFGWWMVEPVASPADSPSVGNLLKQLANLRAETLVAEKADDLARYGLKKPALTVTWSRAPEFSMVPKSPPPGQGGSPGTIALEEHSLLIGSALTGRPNARYAKLDDGPLIFTLGPESLGLLDAEWHDHHVLSIDSKHLRKVKLDWPDRGFVMSALAQGTSGPRWVIEGQDVSPDFDYSQFKPLLEATWNLSTTRFVQYEGDLLGVPGLNPARLTIRFDQDDGSPPRTLRIGGTAGPGQLFATTSAGKEGVVFLVPEALFANWTRPPRRPDDLPENVFAP